MDREYVGIRQATQKGYIECEIGGVADFSYPTSKLRRGRVQGGGHVCPTLTSQSMGICRIEKSVRGAGRYAAYQQSYGKEYRNGKGRADFQRWKSMRICLF